MVYGAYISIFNVTCHFLLNLAVHGFSCQALTKTEPKKKNNTKSQKWNTARYIGFKYSVGAFFSHHDVPLQAICWATNRFSCEVVGSKPAEAQGRSFTAGMQSDTITEKQHPVTTTTCDAASNTVGACLHGTTSHGPPCPDISVASSSLP